MSQWICKNPSHLTSRNRVTSLFSSLCNEFSIRLKSCIWTNLWKQRLFVQMRLTWLLGHNAHLEKIKHTSAKKPHTNCHRWWWRADDVALFCSPSLGVLQPVSSPWTLLYSKIFWSGNYTDWKKWTNVKSNGPVLSWSWFYMFFCLFVCFLAVTKG